MAIHKTFILVITHLLIGIAGFSAGIYYLPIITAPSSPPIGLVEAIADKAIYKGIFKRELADSDWLHWGEGTVYLDKTTISFNGKLAPGPDYKLYLSPTFIETEKDFKQQKSSMLRIDDVRSFDRFITRLPRNVNIDNFNTVIIWCETFSQFITAAQYR